MKATSYVALAMIAGTGIGWGLHGLVSKASPEPPMMFYNSVYHTAYRDPKTLPCDYPHPSEFTNEQWAEFAKRCR